MSTPTIHLTGAKTNPTTKLVTKPESKPAETLGTKDVAARLKIEPRYLRMVLRATRGKAPGEVYQFTEKDLPKLQQMVKDYEAKKGAADKKAAEKK